MNNIISKETAKRILVYLVIFVIAVCFVKYTKPIYNSKFSIIYFPIDKSKKYSAADKIQVFLHINVPYRTLGTIKTVRYIPEQFTPVLKQKLFQKSIIPAKKLASEHGANGLLIKANYYGVDSSQFNVHRVIANAIFISKKQMYELKRNKG